MIDREADIYEVYSEALSINQNFIIRAKNTRKVNKSSRGSMDGEKIVTSLASSWCEKHQERVQKPTREARADGSPGHQLVQGDPSGLPPFGTRPRCFSHHGLAKEKPLGVVDLEVRDRHSPTEYREAKLELKAIKVDMTLPRAKSILDHEFEAEKISLTVISAREIDTEDGDGIDWTLITNTDVSTAEQVLYCVSCYSKRWNIEVFHRILKTGCRVEDVRFCDADKIKIYAAFCSIIAWYIHWITKITREIPEVSASTFFNKADLKLLRIQFEKKKIGRSKKLTLHQCIVYIARLGGFLARKSDGFPGPTTIWKGMIRFLEQKRIKELLEGQEFE